MKKAIVTTTINEPTAAILKFIQIAERDDWTIIVVGDKKTPHDSYLKLCQEHGCMAYVSPAKQESKYKELSDLIGWNCIQRRNIGFIEAYNTGHEMIATVDDDNIPYDTWGQNLAYGQKSPTALFQSPDLVFDPISVTENSGLWHRGFPHELLARRHRAKFLGRFNRPSPLVQADLWDGEPDVDAVCRIAKGPFDVKFENEPFAGTSPGPFNSQNTFLHKSLFPIYFLFPHIGRMDDIWASYVVQKFFPDSVVYGRATVYQERNVHNLYKDLKNEMTGYENSLALCRELYQPASDDPDAWQQFLPEAAVKAYASYKSYFRTDLSTDNPQPPQEPPTPTPGQLDPADPAA